jgi:sphingosine kinase
MFAYIKQSSYASHDLYNNPGAGLVNGVFTVFVIRSNISRVNLATLFIAMETGDHLNCAGLEVYKATAYRLEPKTDRGLYSLDGEVIPYGPVQANLEAGFARIISLPFGGLKQEV